MMGQQGEFGVNLGLCPEAAARLFTLRGNKERERSYPVIRLVIRKSHRILQLWVDPGNRVVLLGGSLKVSVPLVRMTLD